MHSLEASLETLRATSSGNKKGIWLERSLV